MKYNIATNNGIQEIEGEPLTILGIKCAIHQTINLFEFENYSFDEWTVSEWSTGMTIHSDLSKEAAIQGATSRLTLHDIKLILDRAKKMLSERGIKFPVNEEAKAWPEFSLPTPRSIN